MNKDALQTRINQMQQQQEQLKEQFQALNGAIQDCQFWLAQLAQEETQAAAQAASTGEQDAQVQPA